MMRRCVSIAGRPRCPTPSRAPRQRRDRHLRRRPPRPPGGDRGRRHRPHLRPAPARGPPPGGAAEADHAVRGQARRDRGPRGRGAGRDPLRRGVRQDRAPRSSSTQVLVEQLGAEQVSVGENFRFGAKAKGDPEMLAARDEFETRVVPLVEVDGETVSSTRIRALVAAGDMEGARRCLGRPVHGRGRGRRRRPARPRARLPDRQHRPRRPPRRSPATASTRPSPTASRRRSTSACGRPSRPAAGVLIETYLIDRDEDLYGSDAAGRLRRAPARREALRRGRGADRPDAARRRGRAARSVLASSGRDAPGCTAFLTR